MSTIFATGETILDIIFRNGQPIAARPGGSMLNSLISLGRMGCHTELISEIAEDQTGLLIKDFLAKNNVGYAHAAGLGGKPSPLALAFLDENNDADYTFYRDFPASRLNIPLPEPEMEDYVLFGSIYSITHEIRDKVTTFLEKARQKGALLLYDPNFRKPHRAELNTLKPMILENIRFADLIRGSHEDFGIIFNETIPEKIFNIISDLGSKILILTTGPGEVFFFSSSKRFSIRIPQIETVSTIGAGDTFNAGLLYGLQRLNIGRDKLGEISTGQWDQVLGLASEMAAAVCRSTENYIPEGFKIPLDFLF